MRATSKRRCATDAVASHLIEHHAVNWSEQRPVEETGDPAGTKRRDLLEVTLVDAVTQPGITREPLVAAQHQLRVVNKGDPPPVDRCAHDQGVWGAWAMSFTD